MKAIGKTIILSTIIALLALSFLGCTGEQGLQGPTGPRGLQGPQGEQGPAGPGSQMWYSYENIGLEDPIYVPPLPGLSLLTSMPISTTFESTLIITFGIQFTCGSPNYLSFDFRFEGTNRSSDSYASLFHEGGGLGYHSVTVIEENVSTGNYNLDVYWTAQDGDFTFYITDWSIVAVAYPLT